MSKTTEAYLSVDSENQKRILGQWYSVLDVDYGEHNDPDSGCDICYEAYQLGIIDEPIADTDS